MSAINKEETEKYIENYQCLLVGDKEHGIRIPEKQEINKFYYQYQGLYVWRNFSKNSTVRKILIFKKGKQ